MVSGEGKGYIWEAGRKKVISEKDDGKVFTGEGERRRPFLKKAKGGI